eukprot:7078527-Prymnesium_polylepis.1
MRERPPPACAERSCATAPRSSCNDERELYADFLNECVPTFRLRTALITSAAGFRWQVVVRLIRLYRAPRPSVARVEKGHKSPLCRICSGAT